MRAPREGALRPARHTPVLSGEQDATGWAAACRRVTTALAAHPLMVAGHGRCWTAVIEASGDEVLAKGGAEGVYTAALPGTGLGLALKADDGARRASEAALLALAGSRVLNRRGAEVGVVRVAVRTP